MRSVSTPIVYAFLLAATVIAATVILSTLLASMQGYSLAPRAVNVEALNTTLTLVVNATDALGNETTVYQNEVNVSVVKGVEASRLPPLLFQYQGFTAARPVVEVNGGSVCQVAFHVIDLGGLRVSGAAKTAVEAAPAALGLECGRPVLESEVVVERPVALVEIRAFASLSLGGDRLVFNRSYTGVCGELVIRVYRVGCVLVAREPG